MPELPEVASFQKFMDTHAVCKKIHKATAFDTYVLKDISKKALESLLTGNKIISTKRHGKNLFSELEKGGILYFHFGMTGYFEIAEDPDDFRYAQLILELQNKKFFAFICKRKLGKIMVLENIEEYLKENKIGPDALSISKKVFLEALKKRSGNIKSLLMNQSFVAGVGNEFSDEILFQTGIHPESTPKNLPDVKAEELYQKMKKILKKSVAANADRKKLEDFYFLENRKAGDNCPGSKGKVEKKTIGGRSAYFCPDQQKLY